MFKNMKIIRTALLAIVIGMTAGLVSPLQAEENGLEAELQNWTFGGVFGTYDTNQLQRGFQVYQQVCSACHSARLLSFRNLSEEGGPSFTESQIKALAATYSIVDPELEAGERPAILADRWPPSFATEREARASNSGALPPDFSVLAKSREVEPQFPKWVFNYFTAYQEGGPDYIYNLLTRYGEAPEEEEIQDGQFWNAYLGRTLAMSPPLGDGFISYSGDGVPETTEQYAADVSAFMMWLADPHMVSRKEIGFRVLIFLFVLAGLMYLVKRKIWRKVAH